MQPSGGWWATAVTGQGNTAAPSQRWSAGHSLLAASCAAAVNSRGVEHTFRWRYEETQLEFWTPLAAYA